MNDVSRKPRVVIDTNTLVSGFLAPRGVPAQILGAWRRGVCELVSSEELVAELRDVLSRPRVLRRVADPDDAAQVVDLLAAFAVPILSLDELPLHCRDSDDDVVLACAFGSSADYIVTFDDDLLVLAGSPELGTIQIVSPVQFLAALRRLEGHESDDGREPQLP